MKAEVVPNHVGVPRMQRAIYDWLRRTPANVECLRVFTLGAGTAETVILEMSVEEALGLGMEVTAERIHGQCDAVMTNNGRETSFGAGWYASNSVVSFLPFKLGSNLRDRDQVFDGSAVSMIAQQQSHGEKLLKMLVDLHEKSFKYSGAVIEQLLAQNERLIARDLQVQRLEEELRSRELSRLTEPEDNERFERVVGLALQVLDHVGMTQALRPPTNRQH